MAAERRPFQDLRRETTIVAPLERTRASRRHFNRTSHRLASEQSKRIGVARIVVPSYHYSAASGVPPRGFDRVTDRAS